MSNGPDDYNSLYPEPPQGVFASPSMNANQHMSPNRFFPGAPQTFIPPTTTAFDDGSAIIYADLPFTSMFGDHMSPTMFYDDSEMRTSSLSTASGPSAPSSAVGSPRSHHDVPTSVPEWPAPQVLSVSPNIVSQGDFFGPGEYSYTGSLDEYTHFEFPQPAKSFIDPTILHSQVRTMGIPTLDAFAQMPQPPNTTFSASPRRSPELKAGSISPYPTGTAAYPQFNSPYLTPTPMDDKRSQASRGSRDSRDSFSGFSAEQVSDGETKEKCPDPTCGRRFKDLKAHMLTHLNERPEKCPIQTCEYNTKGFARKYDKNRHTLTHYKGTMVCGFCPGSGSPAEKSFNRADVFKRHLTSVHGVEQNPPNSRKRPAGSSGAQKLSTYAPDATGKCSTCSQTFSNAQDFYEHLDDCVLRIVQQEDPAEAVNASRLAEVENDKEVQATLEKNQVFSAADVSALGNGEDEDDEDMDDEECNGDDSPKDSLRGMSGSPKKTKTGPTNGIQKSRGMTHSRGGVPFTGKPRSRRSRQNYPTSWGFDKGQMTMRKRVMTVFEGPRRLAKDDMMLSTEHEVRLKLSDGKSYVTDLDVQTLKRAEGFLTATDEEKGPWISDDPTAEQIKQMQVGI
ncbi:hypothetical protein SEUCBS140593_004765 [Sporothrix eucalyptigena]|uniref:C2H2-type domain-containing protein n=1 Tax=Sporothrix eucalyptigena TaxID=1812306 RepID=A0ABP0BSK6_9PEZI